MLELTDGVPLDAEIAPLCRAFAGRGIRTIYSCGAHVHATPPARRAYVTFATLDAPWVAALRVFLIDAPPELRPLGRELRFDCLHGRYTLSVWSPERTTGRTELDGALAALAAWVRARPRARTRDGQWCSVPAGGTPDVIPCRLTLSAPPDACGWTGAALGTC